jgi:hypothetical protein
LRKSVYDLYESSSNDRCRFVLGRAGERKILVIGLNPSTATRDASDTTVAKVEEVARRNGHDGFVMLNLYPVRATDHRTLPRRADATQMRHNLDVIEALVEAEAAPVLWAAWGASVRGRPFFMSAASELLARLRRYQPRWQCYGPPTADGHPRHPSRLSYAWRFSAFGADAYARRIAAGERSAL